MVDAAHLTSLKEVIDFWQHWITQLDIEPDIQVAGQMACVISNPHFDAWYEDSYGQAIGFATVFDLVADLETPIERELPRAEAWARVKAVLRQLEHNKDQRLR